MQVHGLLLSINALVAAGLPQPETWLPELVHQLTQRTWLLTHRPACSLAVQAEYVRAIQAACTLASLHSAADSAVSHQAAQLHSSVASLLREQVLRSPTPGSLPSDGEQAAAGSAHTNGSLSAAQQPTGISVPSSQRGTPADPMWVQFAKQALSFLLAAPGLQPCLRDTGKGPAADAPSACQQTDQGGGASTEQLAADAQAALHSRHYEVRAACFKLLGRRSAGGCSCVDTWSHACPTLSASAAKSVSTQCRSCQLGTQGHEAFDLQAEQICLQACLHVFT